MQHRETNKKQQGFILFVVMILLQALALLGWYILQSVMMEKKMIHRHLQQQIILSTGEFLLKNIEDNLQQTIPPCKIETAKRNARCTGNFQGFKYYYAVEWLSNDNCALIVGTQKMAAYYRVNLSVKPAHSQPVLHLQSTIIRPENREDACIGVSRTVLSGRQSWQIIHLEKGLRYDNTER